MAPKEDLKEELPEGHIQRTEEVLYVDKGYTPQKKAERDAAREKLKMPKWRHNDIVVSGMSGRFPESESVEEFERNLYNNVDMVVEDDRRWPLGYLGLPHGSGKIKDISLFDNKFFGISEKEANLMDSQLRILLEITFEALWDAGIDPAKLAGSKTGVFLGNCFDEYNAAYAEDAINMPDYRQCFFAILHNIYDFRGPAKHFDSACASGFSAMHEAVVSLRSGECDQAIVAGVNICLRAGTQYQFLNLNMLSMDGHCKCLDDDADGYAKGEACVAIILQKKEDAKRIYANIIHTKTNCDGYKDLGITYPSFEMQRELIEDTYHEVGMDPREVPFNEAHCTGTQAGDPSEMRAVCEAMCKDRKEPILVGALKSVIGHTEAASGICSLIKAILSFENEYIPANLHMKKINHRIDGLVSGILEPINQNIPFKGQYVALNCFGFGGVNVHAIIQKNQKEPPVNDFGQLPRLIAFCGRNQETLDKIYQFLTKHPEKVTPDFLALLNEVSKTSAFPSPLFKGMRYRAVAIFKAVDNQLKPDGELKTNKIKDKVKPPVCFVYTGMGCQWPGMGSDLNQIPIISNVLDQCVKILKNLDQNFDLMQLLTSNDAKQLQLPINSFVAIAAIQIALTEFIKELGIKPDFIVGHSIGELICAFADGCLNLEETITAAYFRGKFIQDVAENQTGKMAALGCSWEQATELCQKYSNGRVWPACHNSLDSVTVSGDQKSIDSFIECIQRDDPDMFIRPVNSSNVAFHCPLVEGISEPLESSLAGVIKSERPISSKWQTTTYDENPKIFNKRYLVDNLIQPVKFHEAFKRLPPNAIFVEIAPHNLLQSIVKRNVMEMTKDPAKYIATLTKKSAGSTQNQVTKLLENVGSLYLQGLNPEIEKLYPKVQYPVARTTAQLHSLICWNHKRKWKVTKYPEYFNHAVKHQTMKTIDLQFPNDKFYADHCIDGRILVPATGYLHLAWEIVSDILGKKMEELPIIFEDVILHRATIVSKSGITDFSMKFNKIDGTFIILQSGTVTVSGTIKFPENNSEFLQFQYMLDEMDKMREKECLLELKTKDIYKEFRLRGYDYGPEFQSIVQLHRYDKSVISEIFFKNWVTFVDGMIQSCVIGRPIRGLYVPVRIKHLRCDPRKFFENIKNSQSSTLNSVFHGILNVGVAPGIEFQGIKANLAPRKIHTIPPSEEAYEFVPHTQHDMLYASSRSNSYERRLYLTNQLVKYQEVCAQLASTGKFDADPSFDLKEYKEKVAEPVLLEILKQADLGNIQPAMLENIEDDLLFRTYLNEVFLRPPLETVNENISDPKVDILEVNKTRTIISKNILRWVSVNTFRMTFTCHLLHSSLNNLDQNQLDVIESQHEWKENKFPDDLTNFDLVVFKDSSLCPLTTTDNEIDFEVIIESLWNCLRDNRFAVILIRDKPFPVERYLMEKLKMPIVSSGSRLAQLMSALNQSSFKIIGHKSDKLGVNALFIRKINIDLIPEDQCYIRITHNIKDWFEDVQKKLKENLDNDPDFKKFVWLYSDEFNSGLIGFVSCLRREPLGAKIRCLINGQKDVRLDIQSDLVKSIVKMNLCFNALGPDGSVGAYHHFSLPAQENEPVMAEHCYLNVVTRGDLSSFRWFESQHKYWPLGRKPEQTLCTVYYAALNFRDVMLASGKLPPDALPDDMGLDDCILGLEFSGRDENGNRIMGMVPSKGLATSVVMENTKFLWPIPPQWTMEEACTVPVAYATAYYALIIRGKMQPKEKVLIHSGSGAVGQAAIAICLSMNCHVYVTVGSEEKRKFLMEKFTDLKPSQFSSSRSTEFEKMVLQDTNGKGVDIVLNSLAEEKLHASVNCLAPYGRFLEIGKFDLSQDNKLNLSKIMKNKTFHGILLDNLFNFGKDVPKMIERHRDQICQLMNEGIEKGVVQPLNRTIFPYDKCEEAFRFMASGKHTGKVVICIREEEKPDEQHKISLNTDLKIPAVPRTVFYPNKSYIVTGGLGGFGLELVNWMIERDARNIIVTSRNGVRDLYQKNRLKYFAERGANVKVYLEETITEEGVQKLIQEAMNMGPLGGIFHLAMVINDGLFENQTLESFENVIKPKANTFLFMDQITRQRSINLDYFVAFSSVSCGLGNPGQTNYGYGNSVMERICDQRRRDGLHGFAIQWGAIGDVGYIIDNIRGNDIIICGSIPQRIPSCLSALDRLLQSSFSVCSSLIKVDHKFEVCSGKASLIKTVAHILGVKDYENLEPNVTLGELGMDSLMAVEVKQAVERDYDILLSMQDIRKLTIGRILEIGKGKSKSNNLLSEDKAKMSESIDEKLIPSKPITYLNEILNGDPIIMLPQMDSSYDEMLPIAKRLNRPVIGINWTKECKDLLTIPETAAHFIHVLETELPNLTGNYDVIGYSFGGLVALEMGLQLQQRKKGGRLERYRKLILLDSSPRQFHVYTEDARKKFMIDDKYNDFAFVGTMVMFLLGKLPIDVMKIRENLLQLKNNEQRISLIRDLFKQLQNIEIKSETLEFLVQTHYNKMLMINQYQCPPKQFQGDLMLIRASEVLIKGFDLLRDDYWIGETIDGNCNLHILKGNHKTFITDNYDEITQLIRGYLTQENS